MAVEVEEAASLVFLFGQPHWKPTAVRDCGKDTHATQGRRRRGADGWGPTVPTDQGWVGDKAQSHSSIASHGRCKWGYLTTWPTDHERDGPDAAAVSAPRAGLAKLRQVKWSCPYY